MLKFNIKKYFSYRMFLKLCLLAFVLFLSSCGDENLGDGSDTNYEKQSQCWQTFIVGATLKIIDVIFGSSAGLVADGGATLVMTAFAVWLALKLLKVLPSFKEENIGEVWTEIFHKLFLCLFCAYIVHSVGNIEWSLNTFVIPLYNTFTDLASSILTTDDAGTIDLGEAGSVTFASEHKTCSATLSASGLRSSIEGMANCVVCLISSRLNAGIKIGISLIGINFASALVGLSMMLFFTLAKFGFVLFLVDSLFRLNFAVVLIPIMIMGIPFSFTRKWALHCFLMFLNSSGVMLFIGFLVGLAIMSLEQMMKHIGTQINAENMEGLGPILMAMLMVSMLLINIPGLGVVLADKFVGGGGDMNFQKKISKFVVNAAKKMGAAVLAALTDGASNSITSSMEKYEKTRDILDTMKQVKNKVSSKLNDIAGYNDDGN